MPFYEGSFCSDDLSPHSYFPQYYIYGNNCIFIEQGMIDCLIDFMATCKNDYLSSFTKWLYNKGITNSINVMPLG
jgi:hypothetical protein